MKFRKFKPQIIALFVVLGLLGFSLFIYVTMLLWNNLAVSIFGLPTITFFQTLGLMVLGRLLTGSIFPRGGGGHYRRHDWRRHRNESARREEDATDSFDMQA